MLKLSEADKIEITILMDNVTDLLISGSDEVIRPAISKNQKPLPPFIAEHGFSALLDIYEGEEKHRILFDTGVSENGVLYNIDRLGIDISSVEGIVLSHGHHDHFKGLKQVLIRIGRPGIPVVLHADAFLKRWAILPNGERIEMPVLEERLLNELGTTLVKIKEPYIIADGLLAVTGEIPRKTEFEKGFPPSYAEAAGKLQPDPLIKDDQALVANLSGKGLVVISGCGHAGIINTLRYALEITGVDRVYALLGGFHLTGKLFEPIIERTIEEIKKIAPKLIVPCHCTGWKATHAIARTMPGSFVQNSVGTTFKFVVNERRA